MDRRVGQYLHKPHSVNVHPVAKQSLFIAETRECYWLPLVIQNAMQEFPTWDLYVCAPTPVLTWLGEKFPEMRGITLDVPPVNTGVHVFNAIMFSPEIWNVFDTEYVLVFQCDTVLASGAAERLPLARDFYGPACGKLAEDEFVINGGLSLRRVKAFRAACTMLTDEDKKLPEDVAFCEVMRRSGTFDLPSLRECLDFAIESVGNPSTCIGIHGTDKGYAPPALLASVIARPKARIVDVVSYDGEPIFETRLRLLERVVDTFVLVQARFTHSGLPKEIIQPPAHPKIKHVIIDEFPQMPDDFGLTDSWIKPESRQAWWREKYQRDYGAGYIDGYDIAVFSDVDEIPNPAILAELRKSDVRRPVHLDMAFLVHAPQWQKREVWHRAFVCSECQSPTAVRTSIPTRLIRDAGWHCSSFFSAERQAQKIRSFAHREHADQVDLDTIRARFESGKDPYGRGAEFDCVRSPQHTWLSYV